MEKRMFSKKELVILIIPMMIEQLLNYAVGFIDTVMVSSVSEVALSATNFANIINNLFIGLFSAFAVGGGVIVSQYLGRKDTQRANLAVKQLVYTISGISFVLMICALLFGKNILDFLYGNVDKEMYNGIVTYYRVTAFSFVFLAIYQGAAAALRTSGNSRVTMNVALYMNLFNAGGNALFIYVFKWGIFGAALATSIARFAAAIVILIYLCSKKNTVRLNNIFKFEFEPAMVKNIIRLGVPGGISGVVTTAGGLLTSNVVASLPSIQIAARAAANGIDPLMGIINSSMGFAIETTVSRCIGAGDFKQAKYYSKLFMSLSFLAGLVIQSVLLIFTHQVMSIFNLSPETAKIAVVYARYYLVTNILLRPALLYSNVFRAAGDVKFIMMNSILRLWVIDVGGAYLLCYGFGMNVFAFSLLTFINFATNAVTGFARFRSGKWLENKVI